MKCKKILLLLLATGFIAAMDHEQDPGIWDEQGQYVAPARYGDMLYLAWYWPIGAEYVCPLFMVPMSAQIVNAQLDVVDTNDNDDVQVSAAAAQTSKVVAQEATVQPESAALVVAQQPGNAAPAPVQAPVARKKHWADDDSDDDELPDLPEGWVAHAKPAVSAWEKKPVLPQEVPPRFRSPHKVNSVFTNQRAVQNDPVQPLGAESENWRERITFDDRLALAARNGRDSRQQFMQLLHRKVYWLADRCYDRKVATESDRLIYILDQNLTDLSINLTDVKALLRLATVCIKSKKRRTALKKENKQGLARVAQKLAYLALSAPLDASQQEKVRKVCDQIEDEISGE